MEIPDQSTIIKEEDNSKSDKFDPDLDFERDQTPLNIKFGLESIKNNKDLLIKHLNYGMEITELFMATFKEIKNNKAFNKALSSTDCGTKHLKNQNESISENSVSFDKKKSLKLQEEGDSSTLLFTEFCIDNLMHTFKNNLEMYDL
mmetsp:Transcript_14288/g.12599  ORF Transcript_14288/g.12599 Transcript_14288/m.12599 type:complete len:146 (-) Transcript_14288:83-520(-)